MSFTTQEEDIEKIKVLEESLIQLKKELQFVVRRLDYILQEVLK